jgi:glycosyltransferase involved in cell wall biosynthesis
MLQPYPIVQLTSSSSVGGTEQKVLTLVKNLDRQLFEPIVLSLVGSGELIEQCRLCGIEAEHLDCRHPLRVRSWRRFFEIVRSRNVALVHLYGLRANLPGRPLARWAGARAVVSGIESIDPWRKWYHTALDRLTARWVDRFVAVCEAARQAAIERERFDPLRVVMIPNAARPMPVVESLDPAALRERLALEPSDGPIVAHIANLAPEKRHRDLIDAAALLATRFPKIVFLCAGRDEMNGSNQRYAAQRGVAECFRWMGHVGNVAEVIAAADFAVLPSSHEGLPVSILEIMTVGRTVIATPVGGVPEVVRDGVNGLLVPARDPKALAEAIERLATDAKLRRRLEIEARETVRRDYSIERMVQETQRLYLELIERRHS